MTSFRTYILPHSGSYAGFFHACPCSSQRLAYGNALSCIYASPDGDGFPVTYSVTHSHTDHSSLITVHSSYTFSAKERDAETGLSYFGARYYSSDLSIWLSVDPMSDKYPSLSPYVYCADNPVKLVDPDGDTVIAYDHFSKKNDKILFERNFWKE